VRALTLRRQVLAPIVIAAVVAFGLSFAARDAEAANQSVSIVNFAYSPASVSVSVGDTVTWTNNDAGIPHTVSSDTPGVFDSGNMNTGATFAKTFTAAGTFTYHCNIHPSMTGTVVVAAVAAATNTPAATATTAAPTATSAAATATATTAAPTATTAAATATTAAPTATSAAAVSPTTAVTQAPQPPATGDGDGSDGGSNALLIGGGIAVLVIAAGATAYGVRQRRA
jgi:plastocyanin